MKKELGKFFLDLAKIIFAVAFLSNILTEKLDNNYVIWISFGITVILALTGLFLLRTIKEK